MTNENHQAPLDTAFSLKQTSSNHTSKENQAKGGLIIEI